MEIIKAMCKALLVIVSLAVIVSLIVVVVEISKIDPMDALGIISFIGIFLILTACFYKFNDKE